MRGTLGGAGGVNLVSRELFNLNKHSNSMFLEEKKIRL